MADERIDIDVSQALGELAKLNKGLADVQGQAKKTGATIDNSFEEGFALGMTDALNNLEKEYAELKRSADTLRNALRNATDPTAIKLYAQSVGQLEAGMKKLETAGKAAGVNLKEANKAAGTGKQVFEGLFGALTKATVILAVISAVKQFATEAITLANNTDRATKSFSAFLGSSEKASKIVSDLTGVAGRLAFPADEILGAGKALLGMGENVDNLVPLMERLAAISRGSGKDFGELSTIYGKARTSGVLFAEDINQLVDAGIPVIQEFGKQFGLVGDDVGAQVKKMASEGKISFEELQLAFFNLTAAGGTYAGQAEAGIQAGDRFNAAWTKALTSVGIVLKPAWDFVLNSLTGILDSVGKLGTANGLNDLGASLVDLVGKVTTPMLLLEKLKERVFGKPKVPIDENADKDAINADRRAYEASLIERDRIEKEAADKRGALVKKNGKEMAAAAAKAEKERSQLVLAAMKEGQEKEIATENFRFSELEKQLKKYHIDTKEATEQHDQNLLGIELKYTMQRIDYDQKLIESRKKEAEFHRGESEKHLKDEKDIRDSEIDLNEAGQKNLIKILEQAGAKKEKVAEVQNEFDKETQRQRLESELKFQEGLLAITGAGDDAQIQQIKNKIAQINIELGGLKIAEPKKQEKKKGQSIFQLLGLDDTFSEDDQKKILDGLQKFADEVKSIADDIFGAKVDRADREVELSQKQIDDAQKFYDAQKALNEQGFANDLGLAQQQLDAAKAKEQKALEQKKQALKEQQKVETALQVLDLITASANIYKSYSTIPFVGVPLAIGVIATMFGAFIAAKARAAQATKFKHGGEGTVSGDGIIVGASHDAGGVGIEAEGGEFWGTDGRRFGVVNKRMTAKHFDLLSAINRDDRSKMRQSLERLTGPTMRRDAISDASGASGSSVVIVNGGGDKKTHSLLKDIKEKTTKTVTVEGNYVVEREGNYTRRRRIRA